jgi:hypothetical protein
VVATAARYGAFVSLATGSNPSITAAIDETAWTPIHYPDAFTDANAAWTVLWAIAHNLTRATGTLASTFHARATTTTIRAPDQRASPDRPTPHPAPTPALALASRLDRTARRGPPAKS